MGIFAIVAALASSTAFAAGLCPSTLVAGMSGADRAAVRAAIAEKPTATLAAARALVAGLTREADDYVRHGRGRLLPHVRPAEALAVLEEATRLVERNDAAGLEKLVLDPRTALRLGAEFDHRPIEVDAIDLIFAEEGEEEMPALDRPGVEVWEWFADHVIDDRRHARKHAAYQAGTCHASRRRVEAWSARSGYSTPVWTDICNTIVVPVRLALRIPLRGSRGTDWPVFPLPKDRDRVVAEADLERFRLTAERVDLFVRTVMLAQWEELLHHVDWVVWTATGKSVSPAVNRLFEKLGLPFEWWAHLELTPLAYGLYDSRALLPASDPARQAVWHSYPRIRHSLARNPEVRSILESPGAPPP